MITPTVGRVVWFWPSAKSGQSNFCYRDSKSPCAALIAYVWGEAMVNLHVIDHNGVGHNFTSVPLIQDVEPRPDGYFCEFPEQAGFMGGSARSQWQQHCQMEREAQCEVPTDAEIEASVDFARYNQDKGGTGCYLVSSYGISGNGRSSYIGEKGLRLARQGAINHLRWQLTPGRAEGGGVMA